MKILVVGGGGREHAFCWALVKSPDCDALYCAPGNAGIADVAECVDIDAEDIDALVAFAVQSSIDLVVVGPEGPLVLGLVDALQDAGILAFGPNKAAAILEGSKAFMKDLFAKYDIPTAAYGRFTDYGRAAAYVRAKGAPIVVKASGLAAGKGVIICDTVDEAIDALGVIMRDGAFGDAGDEVVIEEFLEGEELSYFALVDGKTALPLVSAQDHKAVHDGDVGPNTGGMGAYSPAPVLTSELEADIMARIIRPTIDGMAAEGRPYSGILFAGLMITEDGPKVIEFNARFGDPECQVQMMRLQSDLLELLLATAEGRLAEMEVSWHDGSALLVVMAADGYPGAYKKDTPINGLGAAGGIDGVTVFHAGTRAEGGQILANGGRVLGVTALAADIKSAQVAAYQAVDLIDWPDGFCRRDIGWRAIDRD
ncbi:MAG: phosphoribosylamine--glycine ligase [Rhodospirillaceae bacterium]|jgi:phosphoribosylamine--glycine ligase|nr:phosphoribosylamine--glycine ligase [Rhodospirillaceae bacterium]MBT3885320.1 phosphoribosylamine--glycine ligase [Rhodospirillaceae bacterium]MBT4118493.1 phosphoribosylamine--glycine ligase [Rhodospirillaceae bacterium]MBT4671955.1 phosphoribosylamine--glycine ligase [Rhodospirillaceae bacterium]MBT4720940.1 phosphoribosylamine--glycine ligase [Rhodospirillaceae bacterium]